MRTFACHPMVRQLRPHLASPEALQQAVAEQRREGYRMLAAWRHDAPCGFAGYRLQRNLIHGRSLYVDDLVTTQDERGGGVGSALLGALKALAREAGCTRLTLDTGGQRAGAALLLPQRPARTRPAFRIRPALTVGKSRTPSTRNPSRRISSMRWKTSAPIRSRRPLEAALVAGHAETQGGCDRSDRGPERDFLRGMHA